VAVAARLAGNSSKQTSAGENTPEPDEGGEKKMEAIVILIAIAFAGGGGGKAGW
jgi:hypothetical protein